MFDDALAIVASLSLTAATGFIIARYARSYWTGRRFTELVGQMTTPLALWLIFGVGGCMLLISPSRNRAIYSAPVNDSDIFFALLLASVAGTAYAAAFRFGWSAVRVPRFGSWAIRRTEHVTWVAIAGLLLIDGLVRAWEIRSGIYYSWGRAAAVASNPGLAASPIAQLGSAFWPFSVALLSFAIVMRWRPRLAGVLLVAMVVLDLAGGQRRRLLYVVVIVGVTYVMFRVSKPTLKHVLVAGAVVMILFAVVFPVVQTARRDFRSVATVDGVATPYSYVTESLGQAAFGLVGFGHDASDGLNLGEAYGETVARLSGWATYLSSIVNRMSTGYAPQGISEARRSVLIVVPGGGDSIDADAAVYAHFDLGSPGLDANGSAVADIFSQLHVFGVVLLFAGTGLLLGGFVRLLFEHGPFGTLLTISGLPAMVPIGDSSAVYLGSLRNYIVVAIAVLVLAHLVDRKPIADPSGESWIEAVGPIGDRS